MNLRVKQRPGALTNIQGADPLGPIDLMGRERHQVYRQLPQVDTELTGPLGGIHMQQRAMITNKLADCSDIIDGAQLIIDQHQ
ncbi:hypothetical protein D3C79_705810 [compost metagenome]